MFTLRTLRLWVLTMVLAALSTQCSNASSSASGSGSPGASSPPGEILGSVQMQLTTPSGLSFSSVRYQLIESSGNVEKSGSIDVSQSSAIATTIAGVRPEQGLTVEFDAASADGSSKCTGTSAPFAVTANHTTQVFVTVSCPGKASTGAVSVNGKVNVCPSIDSAAANPSEVNVGGTIGLTASATDPDGGPSPLTYKWSVMGAQGSLSDASVGSTSFVCSSSSAGSITLTVSDGDPHCDATVTFAVTCDATGVTLYPNVHIADAATNAALTGYDASSGLLTFAIATAAVAALQPGDVLISGGPVAPVAPFGYMRKVVSVQLTGGGAQVSTTQATVKDVVSSAKIAWSQRYSSPVGVTRFSPTIPGVSLGGASGGADAGPGKNGAGANPPAASGAAPATNGFLPQTQVLNLPGIPPQPVTPIAAPPSSGLNINLNNVVIQYPPGDQFSDGGFDDAGGQGGLSGQIQVTLNGWLNLNPNVFVHLDVEGCGFLCAYVHEFDAGAELDQSADVQANIQASLTYEVKQKIAEFDLGAFCTYVLCWFPKFQVYAHVSVTGQVTFTIHATDQVHVEAGAAWNDDHMGNSGWTNLSSSSANGSFDVPASQASITGKAGAVAEFDLLLYDVVGATATGEADLVLDIAIPRRPVVDFRLALTQSVGVEVSIFGFWQIGYNASFPEVDFDLGHSPNIPPIITGTSPDSGSTWSVDTVTLTSSAYDLQDATNVTYSWTDETGRALGTGASVTLPSGYPLGVHDFTVTVTDSAGGTTTGTISNVTLTPPPPPTITITQPSIGASESTGIAFELEGTVVDDRGFPHCGDSTWSIAWVDQTTGAQLATSCTGTATLTTPGTHTLALTASGPSGSSGSRTVTVSAATPGQLTVSFTGLTSNVVGQDFCLPDPALTLTASAAGGAPPYTYSWTAQPLPSSGADPTPVSLGTGPSIMTSAFPSNWSSLLSPVESQSTGETVAITVQVTDATGATAQSHSPTGPGPVTCNWSCAPP